MPDPTMKGDYSAQNLHYLRQIEPTIHDELHLLSDPKPEL